MKLSPEQITSALLTVAPSMKQATGPAECILLTRVAVDVCGACQVPARPLAVTVDLHSDREPETPVRLGFPGDVEGAELWDGHLVCIADERLLLDLTIDSMTIPELGLQPEPLCWPIDPAFLAGGTIRVPVAGGSADYAALPDRRDYLGEPKWEPMPADRINVLARKVTAFARSSKSM